MQSLYSDITLYPPKNYELSLPTILILLEIRVWFFELLSFLPMVCVLYESVAVAEGLYPL